MYINHFRRMNTIRDCTLVARISKILIDYGAKSFTYLYTVCKLNHNNGELCYKCKYILRYLFRQVRGEFHDFTYLDGAYLFAADDVLEYIKLGECVKPKYMMSCGVEFDREISLQLLRNGMVCVEMLPFITDDMIRERFIRGDLPGINIEVMRVYPNLFNARMCIMLLNELRRPDLSRDEIALKCNIAGSMYYFNKALQDMIKDELTELFPLMVFKEYHKIRTAIMVERDITAAECPIDLIDRVLGFSNVRKYVNHVERCINNFIDYVHDVKYKTEIARLIIDKYPQYLACLLIDSKHANDKRIFKPDIDLPEYSNSGNIAQLLLKNIKHDYMLIDYLAPFDRFSISADDANAIIDIACQDCVLLRMLNNNESATMTKLYTISDIIMINDGIAEADFNDDTVSYYMSKTTSDTNNFIPRFKYLGEEEEHWYNANEISLRHIMNLISRDARVLNLISYNNSNKAESRRYLYDSVIRDVRNLIQRYGDFTILLPALYSNFYRRLVLLTKIIEKYKLPTDITDLIMIYYVKPRANDADIAQLLIISRDE
jgi:hypothetical protein